VLEAASNICSKLLLLLLPGNSSSLITCAIRDTTQHASGTWMLDDCWPHLPLAAVAADSSECLLLLLLLLLLRLLPLLPALLAGGGPAACCISRSGHACIAAAASSATGSTVSLQQCGSCCML
jgi:hypothetical protein